MDKLELCENCGRGGYNHRRLALLVDGRVEAQAIFCRPCAVSPVGEILVLLCNREAPAINEVKT